jgi:hypothetical protein
MNRVFRNIPTLTILGIGIASVSLYADWGNETYVWFQRSGSLLVLIGAILSYRSIFRLGVKGVGGTPTGARISKVKGSYTDENGRQIVQVEHSPEDIEYDRQVFMDKLAGYIGAIFAIFGTIIWGYGDLVAKI